MANNLEQYRIIETISEKIYQMTENIEACTLDSGSFEIVLFSRLNDTFIVTLNVVNVVLTRVLPSVYLSSIMQIRLLCKAMGLMRQPSF